MKKIIIHILIIAALFFVFDRATGFVLKQLYSHSNTTDEYKIGYANTETNEDLLFMGSSMLGERISSSKYPMYRDYVQQVHKYLPSRRYD